MYCLRGACWRAPILALALIWVSASSAVAGPEGRYRLYPGQARPPNAVSILASAEDSPSRELPLLVKVIDGVRGPDRWHVYCHSLDHTFSLELLPGPHILEVSYEGEESSAYGFRSKAISKRDSVLTIVTEPGRLYRLVAVKSGANWGLQVVDVGPIPPTFSRPNKSCESFPKDRGGCLPASADR
jgi:hypothetical protein